MDKKIMNLAVEFPHAYPWKKSELGLEEQEIIEILKKYNLETYEKRSIANFKVRVSIYKNISKVNDLDKLISLVYDELKLKNYISKNLIKSIMYKKLVSKQFELIIFKKFIDNTLTSEEIVENINCIYRWMVSLVSLYMSTKSLEVKNIEVISEVKNIFKNNFNNIIFNKEKVERLQFQQGFKNRVNFEILYKNFKESNEIFENLLSKFIKENNLSEYDETKGLDDLLCDLFNDDFLNEEKNDGGVNDDLKNDVEDILEEKSENFKGIIDDINNSKEEVKELNEKINQLKKEIIEENTEITEEEENEIKIFRDLASIKKGAVISELYNAFKNIDNISKDNLEAVMSNFFTSLRILGIEVDNEKSIGDEIKVDTKDVLKEFVFSKSISAEGEVKGTIEYLSWMYKGKKITPMVIKPNK